ncbi:MAG: hypothetical protein Q9225_003875 [Loekoesia sp. 1 TL-2023]
MVSNHWHYLSPQRLWGLPKGTPHVNVRADFMADISNSQVTTYIWFLCNGHAGPGHFTQVGIGKPHQGNGPAANGDITIPQDVMARLVEGFDHWFNFDPVSLDASFQDRLHQIRAPKPTYIPTLRRVAADHPSLPAFEKLLDGLVNPPKSPTLAVESPATETLQAAQIIENDLDNFRREQAAPSSQGFVYLIHMDGTAFYKIGMSLDPQLRLRTLQTGNPHALHILNSRPVPDMRSAETSLHRRFEAYRVQNLIAREWFDFGRGIEDVEFAFRHLSDI